jgi:hypothetical protein
MHPVYSRAKEASKFLNIKHMISPYLLDFYHFSVTYAMVRNTFLSF